MALITCPECGREVSDQAEACPNCGYPIAKKDEKKEEKKDEKEEKKDEKKEEKKDVDDLVRIKMCILNTTRLNPRQKASVRLVGRSQKKTVLWQGRVGEIAEFRLEGKADVKVKYHLNILRYGGHCKGTIDTSLGNKYQIVARRGIMRTILTIQRVDMLTTD